LWSAFKNIFIGFVTHGEFMALTKKQRKLVFAKSGGRCWYCGCELPEKGWHADHYNAVYRDTCGLGKPQHDTLDNIVPSCAPCNLFKKVFSVEEFRAEIQQQVHRARKTSVNFRTAERFGMIEPNDRPVLFWFEKKRFIKVK